jgi:hypothetical protein
MGGIERYDRHATRGCAMAVEDHPIFPIFKESLERLIATKEAYDKAIEQHGEGSVPAKNAKSDYGFALHAYHMISNQI